MGTTLSFAQSNPTIASLKKEDKRYVEVGRDVLHGYQRHEGGTFHRVDTGKYADMPSGVKSLYTHTPGMYVHFKTTSTTIRALWCTTRAKSYNNLTAIAFEGLDLYINRDGQWVHAGVGRPGANDCNAHTLVSNMDEGEKEGLLYLPLYDGVEGLELEIDLDAELTFLPSPFKPKVPIYGTSIVHGASASRAGLAYPARLSRMLGVDFINLGISGSAKMEASVAKMIADYEMDALILDCIPNCSPNDIQERTATFIQIIREKHPTLPILAIEGAMFESGNFNRAIADDMNLRNERFRAEIKALQAHDPHIYLLGAEGLLGDDHEGTIDGTHPNDLGFDRMIQKILPFTKNILTKYKLL
jgi:hypothetical protein